MIEQLVPNHIENLNIEKEHFIDFYLSSKKFLTYDESNSETAPNLMKETYSNFSAHFGKLNHSEIIKTDLSNEVQTQVSVLTNEQNTKFILKKFWIFVNQNQLLALDKFLNDRYIEYSIMKIFNGCPNSTQPLGFNIIHLSLKNLIVTELLTSFGGTYLASLIPINDPIKLLEIFERLINSLKYLECYKIEHNDIKLENILVDEVLGKMILRVIDFDLAKNQSYTQANSIRLGLQGYTSIYEAPEIYQIAKEGLQRTKSFSPWKAQIYSLVIVMLKLMGFFGIEISAIEYEAMKVSEQKYKKFMDTYYKYYLKSKKNGQLSIILKLIEICISYKPENRLSSTELVSLIEKIHLSTPKSIEEEAKLIIEKKRIIGKKILKKNN